MELKRNIKHFNNTMCQVKHHTRTSYQSSLMFLHQLNLLLHAFHKNVAKQLPVHDVNDHTPKTRYTTAN